MTGSSVRLEPLRRGHADALFAGLADPAVNRFLDDDPPGSIEWLRDRFEQLARGAPAEVGEIWLNWAVAVGRRVVGTTQATIRPDRATSIACVLVADAWGAGIGRAAVHLTLERLTVDHAITIVQAEVDPRNERSLRLLRSLGFHEDGTAGADLRFVRRPGE